MISSGKPMKISYYLFIDHCAEGILPTHPEDGEEIMGIPYGWYGENSSPFVEHRKAGKVTRTVNCADISFIEFVAE